jgi:hypothetical protein
VEEGQKPTKRRECAGDAGADKDQAEGQRVDALGILNPEKNCVQVASEERLLTGFLHKHQRTSREEVPEQEATFSRLQPSSPPAKIKRARDIPGTFSLKRFHFAPNYPFYGFQPKVRFVSNGYSRSNSGSRGNKGGERNDRHSWSAQQ